MFFISSLLTNFSVCDTIHLTFNLIVNCSGIYVKNQYNSPSPQARQWGPLAVDEDNTVCTNNRLSPQTRRGALRASAIKPN